MLEQVLESLKVPYKLIDEDKGFKLVKVNSKLHILYLYVKGNRFLMERDYFDYIDGNSIPYSILCHDTLNKKIFFLKLNKRANWVKSCSETSDKEQLFLGKNVLKAQITEEELKKELMKYK